MSSATDDYFRSTIDRLRADLDDLERCWLNNRQGEAAPVPTTISAYQQITTRQAASLAQVSRSTIWEWAKKGYITAYGKGRSVRYRLAEVERWLEQRGRASA